MAIIFSDYIQVTHKGREIPSLKIHKSNDNKFMFDLRINGKRQRKVITVNGSTRGKSIELAEFALQQYISEQSKSQSKSVTASPQMSMNDYFDRLCDIKRNSWSDDHRYKLKNFFDKYVKDLIGDKAVSAVKSSDITTIASNVSHLSKRSQKRLTEVLHPLFELAIEDESIQISPIKKSHRVTRKLVEEKRVSSAELNSAVFSNNFYVS